jgi:hypothetical protein
LPPSSGPKKLFQQEPASKQVASRMTLKMEAICSSETSVATHQTTRRHIPEDDTLHNHRCENLKSYILSTNFYFLFFYNSSILPFHSASIFFQLWLLFNSHARIKEDEIGGHVASMGEKKNVYKVLVTKTPLKIFRR